ncbi:MAG: ATP-dependent Clp protease adaptor ClpS [Chloroflexi bacterium AL-W]|nr:ATP-dependent Clp protease adaptor ClpS [Chloroflexi bacterium AL-N1]NOK68263.1 ATP-dependent Clp protease adaptor ClpS [Chloroflexi bacterium AL-N10]NOK73909.1 ATP-dependent Clp protease adaptor ClpS [Chloroflexi bacterium AL-N5]NOK82877.1 ATP-dependent Clp protease adaptor ClpS [Chloroflexi bacterium AL-W]NOK90399.1 ATP-dependent Clp protease adaptor ClpS [Chloroflexi bacterium AL-N15]
MPQDTITIPKTTTTTDIEYVVANKEELEKPFRVIIQNDDVTPMEFVVAVLMQIFGLTADRAVEVMFEAHEKNRALVTTLPLKEAQERVYMAQSIARNAGYPLSFYLEPDE